MRILIIGAKDPESDMNNTLQAAHDDLLLLKQWQPSLEIICYDVAYPCTINIDGIQYKNEPYFTGDTDKLCKISMNIIIEFCNALDENFINHSTYGNRQYENLMKYSGFNIAILSCGCGWNQGFPVQCVKEVIYNKFITPYDAYSLDNFLYVISVTQTIRNNTTHDYMQPYVKGLYQCMGTLMWRGSQSDEYYSENIIRELFQIVGTDMVSINDVQELEDFIQGAKHWNHLKWSLRKQLNDYIYGGI
jgi:hypothetical protein